MSQDGGTLPRTEFVLKVKRSRDLERGGGGGGGGAARGALYFKSQNKS